MKYLDFKKKAEEGQEFSAYIFVGEDAYFRSRGVALLKDAYLSEPSLNLATFDGDNFDFSEMLASLNAYPFMSKKRFTVCREYYPKQEAFKGGLKDFLEAPVGDGVLVIVNEKSDKALEPFKKYPSVCFIECDKQDPTLVARWIKGECTSNQVVIDLETAKLLCEYCLADMTRIERETAKLIDFVGKGGTITADTLDELVARDTEYKIYEMTDYIGKKQFDKAIAVITDMLGKGEPAQRIIISVYNYYRRLLHAAISGKTDLELAVAFNIKEFAAKKLKEQANRFKKRSLKKAVDLLADADYKIKSGLIGQDEAMWLSIFNIMTEK